MTEKTRENLIDILGVPSVNLILGKRGAGKTAFGYKVLEEAYARGLSPYILGPPQAKWDILPDYITPIVDPNDIGDDSAVLMDETYQYMFARESSGAFNKLMAKMIGISRQKNQVFMFATHLARKLDVSAIYDSDNIVFREPSALHARMERREISDLIGNAFDFYKSVSEPVKYAYIYTPEGSREVNIELPPFWSEDLSKAFANIDLSGGDKDEGKPKLNANQRRVLENILEFEEEGDYNQEWGWEFEDIEGMNGGLISKFLSDGLIERGFTTNSTKCYHGNIEEIKELLKK